MPFRRITTLAILLAGAAPAFAQTGGGEPASRISNRILSALVEANGVPGMGAAVWRDGRIVWTGSAGRRDLAGNLPVDENTVFRFASVSKIFAVTAAARLRQEGRLDVDAPATTIISGLNPSWAPFNARQLAAHVSGMPHYQMPLDAAVGGAPVTSMREAIAIAANRALLTPPGAAYQYSTHGYTLLSAMVEARAGRPYLDYLAEAITPGLGIGADATAGADPNASRAYAFVEGQIRDARRRDFSFSWGGAGLGGTPRDLATFGGRLLAGEIVSRETLEWMQEPVRLADETPAGEDGYQLGFGLRVESDEDGQRLAHHSGVTDGARSVLLLYPDQGVAVSILSNALWVSSIERSARTLSAPFRAAPPDLPTRPCPVEAVRYRGAYGDQPIEGSARFRVEDGICVGELSVANAFGAWMNAPPQRDATSVQLIGIDADGGFSRAALVTPVGAYELRAGGQDFVSLIGPTRTLRLHFES